MSGSILLRRLSASLVFAYPVLAHVAIARGSIVTTVFAVGLLAVMMIMPGLLHGSIGAYACLPLIGAGCWWIAQSPIPVLPLFIAPILVPAFMAWVFGRTLGAGRTPLIAQLIRLVHPPGDEPSADVWPYARRLTVAWTALFVAIASANFVLALLAQPDGLLLSSGLRPPFTVPLECWSIFAHLLGHLLVAAFFLIEYAYRRRRFPQQPYRNMFDFLRRMGAAMPRLIAAGERDEPIPVEPVADPPVPGHHGSSSAGRRSGRS